MSNKEEEKMHTVFFKSSLYNTQIIVNELDRIINIQNNFDEAHLINFRRQLININFSLYCLKQDMKRIKRKQIK